MSTTNIHKIISRNNLKIERYNVINNSLLSLIKDGNVDHINQINDMIGNGIAGKVLKNIGNVAKKVGTVAKKVGKTIRNSLKKESIVLKTDLKNLQEKLSSIKNIQVNTSKSGQNLLLTKTHDLSWHINEIDNTLKKIEKATLKNNSTDLKSAKQYLNDVIESSNITIKLYIPKIKKIEEDEIQRELEYQERQRELDEKKKDLEYQEMRDAYNKHSFNSQSTESSIESLDFSN